MLGKNMGECCCFCVSGLNGPAPEETAGQVNPRHAYTFTGKCAFWRVYLAVSLALSVVFNGNGEFSIVSMTSSAFCFTASYLRALHSPDDDCVCDDNDNGHDTNADDDDDDGDGGRRPSAFCFSSNLCTNSWAIGGLLCSFTPQRHRLSSQSQQ